MIIIILKLTSVVTVSVTDIGLLAQSTGGQGETVINRTRGSGRVVTLYLGMQENRLFP